MPKDPEYQVVALLHPRCELRVALLGPALRDEGEAVFGGDGVAWAPLRRGKGVPHPQRIDSLGGVGGC